MQLRLEILLALLLGVSTVMSDSTISRATATNCNVNNVGENVCKLNIDALVLGDAPAIQLTVNQGGRIITCARGQRGDALDNWYGDCDGDARDVNFVIVEDHDGSKKLFGAIAVGVDACRITTSISGETNIACVPLIAVSLGAKPNTETPPSVQDSDHDRKLRFGFIPSTQNLRQGQENRRLYDDSGTTIDIMFVWTAAAECGMSNLESPCVFSPTTELNMMGQINLAVATTNTAFVESGVSTQLRLVHAYRHGTYIEADVYRHSAANRALRKYPDVRAKRALYGADMVAVIIAAAPQSSSCSGIAWTPDWTSAPSSYFSDQMFSATDHNCFLRGHHDVFTHELGHNFGCQHDRGTDNTCDTMLDQYYFGYRHPLGEFISIMSYQDTRRGDGTNQCDNIAVPIVWHTANRFSNPNILYRGQKIGSPRENNARFLNEKKAGVAAMFPAMNCKSDSECNDGDAATVDTCNLSNAACVFTPKVLPAPTRVPVKAPTKAPTMTPTRAPIKLPTNAPVKAPTKAPTMTPTRAPIKLPTNAPVKPPTKAPTKAPTRAPIKLPTNAPVKPPTKAPTKTPTRAPIKLPTNAPVKPPTKAPTMTPTRAPIKLPSKAPTFRPTAFPTQEPTTSAPTANPTTLFPTPEPTLEPTTSEPTLAPTKSPTKPPTRAPVKPPTKSPTKQPTQVPLKPPTKAPLKPPTKVPTKQPTTAPLKPPTKAPKSPTKAPIKITKAPIKAPIQAPVKMPVKAPVISPRAPLRAPISGPMKVTAPISAPNARAPFAAPNARAPFAAPKAPVKAPVSAPKASPMRAPFNAPKAAPVTSPLNSPTATIRAPLKAPTAPIRAPLNAPKAPIRAPFNAPKAPVKAPATAPRAPVKSPTQKPPTKAPIKPPTRSPIKPPTRSPIKPPTRSPIKPPTKSPTKHPTTAPTMVPTKFPTKHPTTASTMVPTKFPTKQPTTAPTMVPTKIPTKQPTKIPTKAPRNPPTRTPTMKPTGPTPDPTWEPTTLHPTIALTYEPTAAVVPTPYPTSYPTRETSPEWPWWGRRRA